jgi:hypothetical protein
LKYSTLHISKIVLKELVENNCFAPGIAEIP